MRILLNTAFVAAFVGVFAILPGIGLAQADAGRSQASLPRAIPETENVSAAQLTKFVEALDSKVDQIHSAMVLRNGKVVLEAYWAPNDAKQPHVLWSLSKSFTSVAVGLAIEEGKLDLYDPVLKFFPEYAPEKPSWQLKSMRVVDLLRMATGHQTEPPRTNDQPWAKTFLEHDVPFKPGTHFQYNTSATYMASAIVQKVTGQTVADYLEPRLFQPLGIETPRWDKSPTGETIGGYGLFLKTEDIAKFGQLLLQKGKWNDKQIVPGNWIESATDFQVSNGSNPDSDWDQGYGYQFWQCRHNAYRGDGKDGQFCVVIPKQNVVVVLTAKTNDLQGELNVVWDELLPALSAEALPADKDANQALQETITNLKDDSDN